MRARLLALAVLMFALLVGRAARAGDPRLVWRTLETPHFYIHYYVEEERLARRVAVVAEAAHDKLVPFFDHEVKHKTHVVLSDQTDDANGSATVIPFPTIRLNATAPDDRSELNDYDDWLSALIMHEYTHVVHLDTTHGVARVINAILGLGELGQVYAPNQAQPHFIIEGLAVFEETERTSGGRLRSSVYDMWLRTATLEGKFQRLDQFSNSPIQFPQGNSIYLYGSAFLHYIASRYGNDVFRRLSHYYGGTWLPGGINRALRDVTGGRGKGETFSTLYGPFRASMEERYRAQLAEVEAAGRREGTPLTSARLYSARPTFTCDGKSVIWADSDGYSRTQFRILDLPTDDAAGTGRGRPPEPRTFLKHAGIGAAALSPDGRTLFFTASQVYRTESFYNDLFAYDLPTREVRQLTHGLRAEAPDLSPDGDTLAFATNSLSSRSLVVASVLRDEGGRVIGVGEPRTLVGNSDDLSQVYTPAWSPDGKTLAFSWWRDGGRRDLWLYRFGDDGGHLEQLTDDRALDLEPRWSPDGRYLYFVSDRTGIYNLYAWEAATGRTWQVTNVIGGVFEPAISPDGKTAVYIEGIADGWRLSRFALEPSRFVTAPVTEPRAPRPLPDVPAGLSELPSRPYEAWRTAWPHTLGLASYHDPFGQVLALSLSGSDVVGHHAWSLTTGFNFGRADAVSFSAGYSYRRYFPTFSLSASRNLTRRGGLYIDGVNHSYVEDDYSASAGVSLPVLRRIDQSATLSFNYNFAWLRNLDRDKVPLDPSLISPVFPETGRVASLGISFSYSNAYRYLYSVSAEEGRSLGISAGFSFHGIGSQYNVATASWRYSEYVPFPFKNHVLILGYRGGISGGDIHRRSNWALGGYAPQPDPLRSFFDFTRPGGATLRGYPYSSIYGNQYHVLNAEYRFPIWRVERGYETLPIYFQLLHGAVFVDAGNAFSGPFDFDNLKNFKVGVGAELRLDAYLFYNVGATFQLGYARGLMSGGKNQVYFLLNNPF